MNYQSLFNHMAENHGLVLLESEIEDIIRVVEKMQRLGGSLPPDVAEKILKARDAFIGKDYDGVWYFLYSIASPNFDKTEPWEDLERMAGR
jgi:hypothetical protein